jgi:hypothetical protein
LTDFLAAGRFFVGAFLAGAFLAAGRFFAVAFGAGTFLAAFFTGPLRFATATSTADVSL